MRTKLHIRLVPYLVFFFLSLSILGPLLGKGYILTLDMVFAPRVDITSLFYGVGNWDVLSRLPFYALLAVGDRILSGWLMQKIFLVAVFFSAGIGAYRLFPFKGLGAYYVGILYVVNPFTYIRFVAGQWGVLAAYAMIPFAVKAFLNLLENANRKNMAKTVALSTVVGLVQIHGLFLLLLVFLVIFLVKAVKERKALPWVSHTYKYLGISAGLFCVLNLYWLVPALTAKDTIVSQLSQADLLAFTTIPSSTFGVAFDTAAMYGFWREGYLHAKDIVPIWWLLYMFILFLAIYGFLSTFNNRNKGWVTISFGAIGILSLILALGISTEITKPLFAWLWEDVPFFRAFRDSQKFVSLLCLSYAYLGGLGANDLTIRLKQQTRRLPTVGMTILVVVALLTPLAYSPTIFGFHRQLGVTEYPKEWYEVNEYLNRDGDDFNVLFLPWHMYMDFSWLPNKEKRLANPARLFFDKPVVQGDNIEMPGLYSQSTNPMSQYLEFLLSRKDRIDNFGELLASLNVKYVILVWEADYEYYDFLYRQKDLIVTIERPGITLLRNTHPTARLYGVNSIVYLNNLEEYLELSKEQDVMEHLYVIGSGFGNSESIEMEKLSSIANSPVKYQVEGTSRRYSVFNGLQNVSTDHWELDGLPPVAYNLGFMPAFESSPDGGEVVYSRFYKVYLPSYIISLITLITLAFIAWYSFKKEL